MQIWLRHLLLCLTALSLVATTGAHACDIWTADGLECVADRGGGADEGREVDKTVAHNHGCNGQSASLPWIPAVAIARQAATAPHRAAVAPLAPRDTEPALRPPAA